MSAFDKKPKRIGENTMCVPREAEETARAKASVRAIIAVFEEQRRGSGLRSEGSERAVGRM